MTTSPMDAAMNLDADFDAAPRILRDLDAAADRTHDLIVIGGGIYGVCVALEASRRGLRPLLLERADYGGATSGSSLRIVHGGFRYLQKLDLHRFRESVQERNWFLRTLPDLVRPLTCLMPLYGDGLRKPAVFRAALAVNDRLSRRRNDGVREDAHIMPGRVIDAAALCERFPQVQSEGLRGGGLWHDALMLSSERVIMELLRWACCCGTYAANYVSVESVVVEGGKVTGVEAIDHVTGQTRRFRAPMVVNCAGPWCRLVSQRLDRDIPQLMRPSMAFNLMLDRPALSDAAVAVAPRKPGARTYFLVPWKGRVFAGTSHVPWHGGLDDTGPTCEQLDTFLDDLNAAVPGFDVRREHILRVYAGILPAVADGSERTSDREVLINHASLGGPRGLVSVSGVKYTTARLVAEKALRLAYGSALQDIDPTRPPPPLGAAERFVDWDDRADEQEIRRLAAEESVVHIDDLLLRRIDLTVGPVRARQLAQTVCEALGYAEEQRMTELARFETIVRGRAFGAGFDAMDASGGNAGLESDPVREVCSR